MGVTIEYLSRDGVSNETLKEVMAVISEPSHQPWLLCEPIHFLPMPGYEGRLFGASKLNLMPDPEDQAEAASYDTDKNDLEFLLDQLTELSARFGIDWSISIEGEPIGSIEGGHCDERVRTTIEAMAEVAGELGELGDFL